MAAPSHYKRCVETVHERLPHVSIELLSSDLAGNDKALEHLLDEHSACRVCPQRGVRAAARPPGARSAGFVRTQFEVLRRAKELRPDLWTKSSIMVGVGETDDEDHVKPWGYCAASKSIC